MVHKLPIFVVLAVAMATTEASLRRLHDMAASTCGDQSMPAKCFANGSLARTLPLAYKSAKAVARLRCVDGNYETGFLVGTASHEASFAKGLLVEFNAESPSCTDECKSKGGCPGKVVTTTTTLIARTDKYALVKIPSSVSLKEYGYLQLRASGPVVGEAIYLPHYPSGWAERIQAYRDDNTQAVVLSTACGDNAVMATVYSELGSGGAPVIAWSDNLVVAVLTCRVCTAGAKGGADVRDILADLEKKNIVIKDLIWKSTPEPTTPEPTTPESTTPKPTTPEPTTPEPTTPEPTTPEPSKTPGHC